MAGEMRAMLDALMGPRRDEAGYVQKYSDPEICRLYLTGLCPHGMFVNTRHEIPPCNKVHSDNLKAEYEEDRKAKKVSYDHEAIDVLGRIVATNDRFLASQREELKLKESIKPAVPADPLQQQIAMLESQAAKAGEEGQLEQYEVLKKQAENLKSQASTERRMTEVKHWVCDTCGSFLEDWGDDQSRYKDHYIGKIHNGFQDIRDQFAKLKKLADGEGRTSGSRERENRDREPNRSRERSPPRRDSRERHNDRSSTKRERSRERERYRDEPYHRRDDRDRDRDRDRHDRDRDHRDKRDDRDRRR
jgi:hypothetical protein